MSVDLPPPVPDAPTDVRAGRADRPNAPTVPHGVRPGDLTLTWRFVVMFGWMFAFFAYAAVWQASVQLGIATWWLGPRSAPTPVLIRMIPFFVTIVGGMMSVYNVRRLSHVSIGIAALTALVALPDFSRSVGLAVVELMISGSLIVVSAASLTGRYRLVLADASVSDDPVSAPAAPAVPAATEAASTAGPPITDAPTPTEAWARPASPSPDAN